MKNRKKREIVKIACSVIGAIMTISLTFDQLKGGN